MVRAIYRVTVRMPDEVVERIDYRQRADVACQGSLHHETLNYTYHTEVVDFERLGDAERCEAALNALAKAEG